MNDTNLDQPIPLSVAAREQFNRRGERGISVATVWRWALRGVRGIRLETSMSGGSRMTTRAAMQRFHQRITAMANCEQSAPRTPHQRQRAIDSAKAELAKDGI